MATKFCTTCGAPLDDGEKFCTTCGAPVPGVAPSPAPESPQPDKQTQPPVYQPPVEPASAAPVYADPVPSGTSPYQPISTGGFVGILLLMCVPVVNLIFLIVWACGGCRKVNKRNYARALLILALIYIVLWVLVVIFAGPFLRDAMREFANSMPGMYGFRMT